MLEIKNLTKVYRTKGGTDTKALDDVSIKFEETGLVFLLGKSGSGKSTLLNVAGGLDDPTSGEVIVMGKSSRDFSGSDFDSYRNTYVGFIFQEYNILNEFNVEDNIALALELQGKKKDREKIKELLEEVDLANYAKRKPNTLSGGQKQRIAIARALIKSPQIIMADEPTGALDSATGKQVFDTLKKLSKTKLVIVVSHDREFAEIYGDRIVELKDGKIISDVIKEKTSAQKLNENIIKIGEDTISIKQGAELTSENLDDIRDFVKNASGNVIISKGKREIANFKKSNRIDDEGSSESFKDTDKDKLNIKEYDGKNTKFIRSRLPASKALKIGASSLKLKPLRLVFTIFLSFIAFVMFGLFSTMMLYDGDSVLKKSFMESDYKYLAVKKFYEERVNVTSSHDDPYDYTRNMDALFTKEEIDAISQQNKDAFGAYGSGRFSTFGNANVKSDFGNYYKLQISRIASLPETNSLRKNLMAGEYPSNKNEICISSYMLECIENSIYMEAGDDGSLLNEKDIKSANDIIGRNVLINGKVFKVSGVFDSGAVAEKYDVLKDRTSSNNDNFMIQMTYQEYIEQGLFCMVFVSDDFIEEYKDELSSEENSYYINYFNYAANNVWLYNVGGNVNGDGYQIGNWSSFKVYDKSAGYDLLDVKFINEAKTKLEGKEIIVPVSFIRNYVYYCLHTLEPEYPEYQDGMTDEEYNILVQKYNEDLEKYNQIYSKIERLTSVYFDGFVYGEDRKPTEEERAQAIGELLEWAVTFGDMEVDLYIGSANEYNVSMASKDGAYKIVGYFEENINSSIGLYCSEKLISKISLYDEYSEKTETNYKKEDGAIYGYVYIPFDKNQSELDRLISIIGYEDKNPSTDVFYELDSILYDNVEMVNDLVSTLSKVFLGVGIGMALFSSLLLFNFISMSINNKKKEIGILRAVGARGIDVFKIFFAESGIIVGICTLISIVGTFVLTNVINNILKTEAGLDVTLFVFGGVSVGLMVAVALVVALVSTFLPVYFAAKKKPVESIRAL